MRMLIVLLACVGMAAAATAGSLDNRPPAKTPRIVVPNVPSAPRLIGDTFGNAIVVPAIPHAAAGTTAGYTNDYDEVCPYSGSTAPDVVYRYLHVDPVILDLDLCGSDYDTKLYVYDSAFDLVACNDDYYHTGDPCGTYVSKIENLTLTIGGVYYIVIDGYGDEYGPYELALAGHEPCLLEQPGWADEEGEPPLHEGYFDSHNGGCNSDGTPLQVLDLQYHNHHWGLWGVSGWYQNGQVNYRDTDWICLVDNDHHGYLTVVVEAEQPMVIIEIFPQECPVMGQPQYREVAACEPETLTTTVFESGSEWTSWLFVAPRTFSPPDGDTEGTFHYSLEVLDYQGLVAQQLDLSADYGLGCPAIPVGVTVYSFSGLDFTNQYVLDPDACVEQATPGPDVVLEVYLAAGHGISVEVGHPWYPRDADAVPDVADFVPFPVYLVDDGRLGPGACRAVAIEAPWGPIWLGFTADVAGFYYLIYDSLAFSWFAGHLHVYNQNGVEPPPPPLHDTCDGAIDLPTGAFSLDDDLSDARNRFDPGRDGCAGPGGTGRDVVYRIAMGAGEHLEATMTGVGDWDEEIYLLRDCTVMTSCLAGGLPDGLGGVRLEYTADEAAVLYLVCDSYGIGPRPFNLTGTLADVVGAAEVLPLALVLESCRPNPFNPMTTMGFSLPATGRCRLAVYGVDGKRVRTLVDDVREAGRHVVVWDGCDADGRSVPSGAYICRLEAGVERRSQRVMLVK